MAASASKKTPLNNKHDRNLTGFKRLTHTAKKLIDYLIILSNH